MVPLHGGYRKYYASRTPNSGKRMKLKSSRYRIWGVGSRHVACISKFLSLEVVSITNSKQKIDTFPVKHVTQIIKIQLYGDHIKTWIYMDSPLQGYFLHIGKANTWLHDFLKTTSLPTEDHIFIVSKGTILIILNMPCKRNDKKEMWWGIFPNISVKILFSS